MFPHWSEIFFLHRWVLWLIPVVWLMGAAWWYWRRKKSYAPLNVSDTRALAKITTSWKGFIKEHLFVLRVLTCTCLLIALARPQTLYDEEKITTEGIDIVMAMDVSTSMLARDFKPNRLEVSKKEALNFINARVHDRIGIVIFAGESFTQCPVTVDRKVLQEQMAKIKNGLLEDGTAIGMGLATAVQRLKESNGKSKVVILMTDGVNNKGLVDPMTAADIALQFGVRVYTIGVGTNGQAETPVAMRPDGSLIFAMADVQIDEPLMKEIAKKTGGQYFRANNQNKLREIYEQIDKLEKTKIELSTYERRSEKFHVFALLAGLLLLADILLRYGIAKSLTG
ncbi:MAG: VWA domain-containing protein [Chitinophagales bacterium]|nr:VWA domain-containing protein [Chitinophagales bacterium]MDW8418012.1 VWA domain-containing protein [Chitinophagales bacterium]